MSEGQTVFVDVTADWCLICKANKTPVLDRGPIADLLNDETVIDMQADWTRPDNEIQLFLERHGRFGIPFNIVIGPSEPAGITLPELLTERKVIDVLDMLSVKIIPRRLFLRPRKLLTASPTSIFLFGSGRFGNATFQAE